MKNQLTTTLVAAALLCAANAGAQTAALEEITVTAERRSENLQDVPIAVTVIAGEAVNDAQITNMADVAQQTPNLKLTTFNISEPQIYLRGIGNSSDSVASDPAVAVFVDDVYIGRPGASTFDLYDLDRIEILRGPQGTLYGKNATGGAIAIYSKKPSDEFELKAGATAGSDGLVGLRAFVNGGLADNVAGKLSVSSRSRDGYSKNTTTGAELDDEDSLSARGQLLITPNEDVEVLLGFDYSNEEPNGNCRTLAKLDVSPQPFGGSQIPYLESIANPERVCTYSTPESTSKTIYGLQARVDWQQSWGTFTSITAYRDSDMEWRQNLGGMDSPPNLLLVDDAAQQDADQISQEFRIASDGGGAFSWLAGLYYYEEDAFRREEFITDFFMFPPFAPFAGNVDFIQKNTTTSTAAFGQINWNITDTLALTVGARYTNDDKTVIQSANDLVDDGSPAAIPLGPGTTYAPVKASEDWSETTPRVSLDWQVSDKHLLFLTYSEGFKSGAFPFQATSAESAVVALKPETVDNTEIGAKTQWWDDRLRINASYFTMDYQDLQVFQLINLQLVSENANKASVDGFEIEVAAALTDKLTFAGTYGNLDSKYDDYVVTNPNTGTVVDNTGNELARAADETWTLALNYATEIPGGASFEANVGLSHVGDYFHEPSNDVRSFQESYDIVDAYIRYTAPDQRWDLTAWGKNLNDELYIQHMITSTFGGAVEIYGPPDNYGVTFNYFWQ